MRLLLIFEIDLREFRHETGWCLNNDYPGVYRWTKEQNYSRSIRTLIYIHFRSISHYILNDRENIVYESLQLQQKKGQFRVTINSNPIILRLLKLLGKKLI